MWCAPGGGGGVGEGRGGVELGMGRPLTHPYRLGERPSLVRSTPSPLLQRANPPSSYTPHPNTTHNLLSLLRRGFSNGQPHLANNAYCKTKLEIPRKILDIAICVPRKRTGGARTVDAVFIEKHNTFKPRVTGEGLISAEEEGRYYLILDLRGSPPLLHPSPSPSSSLISPPSSSSSL